MRCILTHQFGKNKLAWQHIALVTVPVKATEDAAGGSVTNAASNEGTLVKSFKIKNTSTFLSDISNVKYLYFM